MYWLSIHMRIFKSFRLFHLTITECFDSILALLFKHCVFNHMSYLNAWNYLFPFIYQSLFRSLSLKNDQMSFFFTLFRAYIPCLYFSDIFYVIMRVFIISFHAIKISFALFIWQITKTCFFQLYFELSLFMHNVFQIYFIS